MANGETPTLSWPTSGVTPVIHTALCQPVETSHELRFITQSQTQSCLLFVGCLLDFLVVTKLQRDRVLSFSKHVAGKGPHIFLKMLVETKTVCKGTCTGLILDRNITPNESQCCFRLYNSQHISVSVHSIHHHIVLCIKVPSNPNVYFNLVSKSSSESPVMHILLK